MSTTIPTQIRIDANLKREANELFDDLGMDMSSAVNIFLSQCVLVGGLPFSVRRPQFRKEVEEAMAETEQILRDPQSARQYHTVEELFADLESEEE